MRNAYRTVVLLLALLLPSLASAQPASTIEYYHTDALGSVRAVTDASGSVVARHDYFPFGEENSPPSASVRFTGKERDGETQLDYFMARYYRATSGRFVSADPGHVNGYVSDPQSWNGYVHARNNPLLYVDPSGTRWFVNGGNATWVDRNEDGTYTSPGEGWVALDPANYNGAMNLAFVNGQLTWIGENANGGKMTGVYLGREEPLEDTTFSFLSNLQFGAGLLRGVAGRVAAMSGRTLAAKATTLAKMVQSEAGVEELLAGGGRAIAGEGLSELKDVSRLVSQYGGKPAEWVKITSTTPGLQTHAYKNIVTGTIVELKSKLPGK